MKIAVLGGGIAGLSSAILMGDPSLGFDISIYEKSDRPGHEGLGFILLENGLQALDELGLREAVKSRGGAIDQFVLRTPDGSVILKEELPSTAVGIKRIDLIDILRSQIPAGIRLELGREFSHFEFDEAGNATRAFFVDGSAVEADLFIGCDGVRSRIRQTLFPDAHLSPTRVRELVCIVKDSSLAAQVQGTFLKTQSQEGGLALGIVPTGPDSLVWYLQCDANRWNPAKEITQAEKREFILSLVGRWADPIPQVIEHTDFGSSHIWNTSDLELLPDFHQKNIVLMGDAAHVFLTFTSQGVNSALQDAIELSHGIKASGRQWDKVNEAIERYGKSRKQQVRPILSSGRDLAQSFLSPAQPGQAKIPLTK